MFSWNSNIIIFPVRRKDKRKDSLRLYHKLFPDQTHPNKSWTVNKCCFHTTEGECTVEVQEFVFCADTSGNVGCRFAERWSVTRCTWLVCNSLRQTKHWILEQLSCQEHILTASSLLYKPSVLHFLVHFSSLAKLHPTEPSDDARALYAIALLTRVNATSYNTNRCH